MNKILKADNFTSHLKNTKLNKKKYQELYKQSITPSERDIPANKNNPKSKILYNLAWSRTNLKRMDAISNELSPGLWSLTDIGKNLDSLEKVRKLHRKSEQKRSKLPK